MYTRRRELSFETLETRCVLSATVYVHIPDSLTGEAGGEVATPVEIDNAEGIRAAEIHINYDTDLLDTDAANVLAGSVWGTDAQVVANVDEEAGTIVVYVFASSALASGGGSLLEVNFTLADSAEVGETTTIDLASVILNEGAIVPDPEPEPGPDETDGLITVVSPSDTASIAGTVYADANGSGTLDANEGIPRVLVVLVNNDTDETRSTYTDDDGSYSFSGLAAGSYSILAEQPTAFLDGDGDQIDVTLTSGQELTDQNFREGGLRAAYVSTRLFTTSVEPVGSYNWNTTIRDIVINSSSSSTTTSTTATASTASTSSTEETTAATTSTDDDSTDDTTTTDDTSDDATVASTSTDDADSETTTGSDTETSDDTESTVSIASASETVETAATTAYVNISDELTGTAGGEVTVGVNIDEAEGVRGAEIHISYDTTLLDIDAEDVTAGTVWPEDAQVVANVDDDAGTIIIAVSTTEALESSSGTLVSLVFTISSSAVVEESTAVNLTEVILNEGEITVDPEPTSDSDAIDGLITFTESGGTAAISGTVYADTDGDSTIDAYEGVAGVKIVLFNTDTEEQWETYTDDDGYYEFTDLAEGNYRVCEEQPDALIDGGDNELSVSLSSGESLTDRNFREHGLTAASVYTRLLSTSIEPVGSDEWDALIEAIL